MISGRHSGIPYKTRGTTGVSWFQPTASAAIALIKRLGISTTAAVIDIGGGALVLADTPLRRGFTEVSVLDVSETALETVRQRLGTGAPVSLLHEDRLALEARAAR